MATYRKRSAEVAAVQWEGGALSAEAAVGWLAERGRRAAYVPETSEPQRAEAIFVESTISGAETVTAPAWFVESEPGRVIVMLPAAFEAEYEVVP